MTMKKISTANMTTGQYIDAAKHIEVHHYDSFGNVISTGVLADESDSVKELSVKVKNYLASGRLFNSNLTTYLESINVDVLGRLKKYNKVGETAPIMTFEIPKNVEDFASTDKGPTDEGVKEVAKVTKRKNG